jgi:hypothetical protein
MISANELRIDNYLLENGGLIRVDLEFYANLLESQSNEHPCDMTKFEPIPITEEILLKGGFEFWCDELGVKCFYKIYGIEYICIAINGFYQLRSGLKDSDAAWRLGNNYPFIKYLHQLQNLYFALTNTELEINDL